MTEKWKISQSLLIGAPAVLEIRREDLAGWAENFRSERDSPGRLEFEGYTNQLDVFIRRNNGRRERFLTFMAT